MKPRALVTGGAIRVGRAIALELAARGFDLAIHFRGSASEAEETAEACRALGSDAWTASADLGTVEGCQELVTAVSARWDALHVLVNNASVFGPKPFEAITIADWEQMQAINLRAPFLLSQGLLPLLRAAEARDLGGPEESGGTVVHLCDIGADRPVNGYAHYSVSKAGLVMLVKSMAVELAPRVRTVGVSPGQVAWPDWYEDERRDKILKRIPLQRVGTGEDVARLVRFLATDGWYLNGVIVPVDGGLSCKY